MNKIWLVGNAAKPGLFPCLYKLFKVSIYTTNWWWVQADIVGKRWVVLSTIRLSDKVVHEYTRAGSKEEEKDGTKCLLDIEENERSEVYIDFIDKYN